MSTTAAASSSGAPSASFVWSYATLLSGRLHDCKDADDESCVAGTAAVNAFLRYHSKGIDQGTLVINQLDYQSPFVQMHPLDWGVNRLVFHDHYGWDVFFGYSSLMTSERDLSTLQTKDIRPLLPPLAAAASNTWSQYIKTLHFDKATGLVIMAVTNDASDYSRGRAQGSLVQVDQTEAALGLLKHVAMLNQELGCADSPNTYQEYMEMHGSWHETNAGEGGQECWIPLIVYRGGNQDRFRSFINTAVEYEYPPAVIIDVRENDNAYNTPQRVGSNGVWVASHRARHTKYFQHRLVMSQDRRSVTNVTVIPEDLWVIPQYVKDETFRSDIKFLRGQADLAAGNDPIQGNSSIMPSVTPGGGLNYCLGGECPMGNLFADAIRWGTGADFSFVNSGGLRGSGWKAGPVRISDIWGAVPFANTVCEGTLSGISVFRLFNFSTSRATFQSTRRKGGDRLLQISGARVTYNTQLEGSRLVGIEIWNNETSSYAQLERLKMYKFATDSWMCTGFDPFPTLLGEASVKGEVAGATGAIGSKLVQTVVGEYLGDLVEPYDTRIQGRLQNNTKVRSALDMIQTEETCPTGTYWEKDYLSCFACPETAKVVFAEELAEFSGESGSAQLHPGKAQVVNGEGFPVSVALKSSPPWIKLAVSAENGTSLTNLDPGESLAVEFVASAQDLEFGTALGSISFGVMDGGSYPGCEGRDATLDVLMRAKRTPQLKKPGSIRSIGLSLMCVAVLTALSFGFWVHYNRKQQIIRSMQPAFLIVLNVGVTIMALSIIPLSLADDINSQKGRDMACMATPWMLSMGFTIVMSALFAKLWRIDKIFNNPRFSRVAVSLKDAFTPFSVLFASNLLLLLVWTVVDPWRWEVHKVQGEEHKLYGSCNNTGTIGWTFFGLTFGWNFCALLLACYEAYKARNISDDYSESKSLALALFSWFQILIVGGPVLLLIEDDNPNAKYFLQVALIFAVCFSMLIIIFSPLVAGLRKSKREGNARMSSVRISGLDLALPNRMASSGTSHPRLSVSKPMTHLIGENQRGSGRREESETSVQTSSLVRDVPPLVSDEDVTETTGVGGGLGEEDFLPVPDDAAQVNVAADSSKDLHSVPEEETAAGDVEAAAPTMEGLHPAAPEEESEAPVKAGSSLTDLPAVPEDATETAVQRPVLEDDARATDVEACPMKGE